MHTADSLHPNAQNQFSEHQDAINHLDMEGADADEEEQVNKLFNDLILFSS
jgi:hypothetical protein